jgi:hypothetical protein
LTSGCLVCAPSSNGPQINRGQREKGKKKMRNTMTHYCRLDTKSTAS